MQNKCAEIKIRCERRGGKLIKEGQEKGEIATQKDTRTNNLLQNKLSPDLRLASPVFPQNLDELGIEATQSHRWQTIADMPEEALENTHMMLI